MKRALPWVLIVVLGLLNGGVWREMQDRGAKVATLTARADSLAQRAARVDTQYVRDTVRLRHTLTRYDSVRTTDTLVRNDTVFVPRDIADAVVASCQATIITCEQRVAVRDSSISTLNARIRAIESLRPSRLNRALKAAAFFSGGYLIGSIRR